jgi:hypothetical protein
MAVSGNSSLNIIFKYSLGRRIYPKISIKKPVIQLPVTLGIDGTSND